MAVAARASVEAEVDDLAVTAYRIPTERRESDGTLSWEATTVVFVEARGGDRAGLGWSYGSPAIGALIEQELAGIVRGRDAMAPQAAWAAMSEAVRNDCVAGLSSYAIAAVDIALWDLKARLLGLPLCDLVGRFRDAVPAYASGGFTSLSPTELQEQLGGWADDGFSTVKMKVGRDPATDPERVRLARSAIGPGRELFVDANGAYTRKQALLLAERFAGQLVSWFEEPVSSDDLEGLRLIRDRGPGGMAVAAGEYGTDLFSFERLAGAVDVLQADVTRCGGITSLLRIDGICKARCLPLSAHCAPQVSAHACCGLETAVHVEYFHDHARLESLLLDGVLEPVRGKLRPDRSRPGLGVELGAEAEEYRL